MYQKKKITSACFLHESRSCSPQNCREGGSAGKFPKQILYSYNYLTAQNASLFPTAESTTGVRSVMEESNSCSSWVWPPKTERVTVVIICCYLESQGNSAQYPVTLYDKTGTPLPALSSELKRNTLTDKDRHKPEVRRMSWESCQAPNATQEHSTSLQNKISPSSWMATWRSLQSCCSQWLSSKHRGYFPVGGY